MSDLSFFHGIVPLQLSVIAECGGAAVPPSADPTRLFHAIAALDRAGPGDVAMVASDDNSGDAGTTRAGACFVGESEAGALPSATIALVTSDPARALSRVAALLHPDSVRPRAVFERVGIDPAAIVHGDARLEAGVSVDPGAIIGPRVEIGAGTTIGANATLAPGVRVGRGCAIDCHVSISDAFIGDQVIIHAGARIGQGGPGLDGDSGPRLGRVIIQNNVEIGANATIARGRLGDTVLGEGCWIGTGAAIEADTCVERHAKQRRS